MVLKSSGNAAENQPSCLGVYRVVDSLNEKPVYKQEGGEHFLYFNADKQSWMVGTNVGDSYAWIKNDSIAHKSSSSASSSDSSSSDEDSDSSSGASLGSTGAGGRVKKFSSDSSSKAHKGSRRRHRLSPDLLEAGWKYKPNGFQLSALSDDENLWMEDDVTLKVEALKGQ